MDVSLFYCLWRSHPFVSLFGKKFTNFIRVFRKLTKLAIMSILASEVLLREKKSSDKMSTPVRIEPGPLITSDSKFNTILSTLTWHVLLRRCLNFCLCTTWCLDDLRRINRAWLYKEPKVSVLQANVKFPQHPQKLVMVFFANWETLAIMAILVSEALLREKNPVVSFGALQWNF